MSILEVTVLKKVYDDTDTVERRSFKNGGL